MKAHASFDGGVVETGADAFCPDAPLVTDDAPQVECGQVLWPQVEHGQRRPAVRRSAPELRRQLGWRVIGVLFDDLAGDQQLGQLLQFPNFPLAPFASA